MLVSVVVMHNLRIGRELFQDRISICPDVGSAAWFCMYRMLGQFQCGNETYFPCAMISICIFLLIHVQAYEQALTEEMLAANVVLQNAEKLNDDVRETDS